jgi:hypothetical protein
MSFEEVVRDSDNDTEATVGPSQPSTQPPAKRQKIAGVPRPPRNPPRLDDLLTGDEQFEEDRCWSCKNPNANDWRCWMKPGVETNSGKACRTCNKRRVHCAWTEEAAEAWAKRKAAEKKEAEKAREALEATDPTPGPSRPRDNTERLLGRISHSLERLVDVAEELLEHLKGEGVEDEEDSDRSEVSSFTECSTIDQNDLVGEASET